ncbi:Polycystic kidney disease protein 1-like 1 [Holothuria leucospilota]|uniref:Polycystic kidney disease protein 1-like 1 n=1 Tax=Holothuria leucospilota TaxID=206669 RepID=A0A9Q1BGD9_HOLLE|nr:Polycystic kidney disease protein 1-like 1 [Holothuria leucospilota]
MEIWSKQVRVTLFTIVFVIVKIGLADKSTWYRGCFINNITQVDNSLTLEAAPTECLRYCSHQGFSFVGLQGIQCVCFQEYAGFPNASDEQCFERCDGLPCGGGLALSIYSTYGPYIHRIQLKSASINQLNSETLFEARIFLASDTSEPAGLEDFNSTTVTSVSYRWVLNGSDVSSGDKVVTNNSAVVALVHEFSEEGQYVIDFLVGNPISQLNATTSITIVQPYPANLQVALSPGQVDIPSCISVSSGLTPSSPAVAVFVDQPTVFQASVVRGVNVSFIWQFGEDIVSTLSSKSCSGIECLEDQQVYTFKEKGTFEVQVNATNYLGSISKTLNVVVLDKSISNLTVELAGRNTAYRKVNSTVRFEVKLDTAGRAVSTLTINFGDGFSYTQSLRDVNDTFISGGTGNSAHLHLSASYGEGCRLLISLDHIYQERGVYQVMVAVSNNYTTEEAFLEEKLEILPHISHLNISSVAVYQTGVLFNVSILNWEELSGVTLYWCVSKNTVVLFPQAANNSWATFVVGEAGRYSLNVSAANTISSASSEIDITVQDPVEAPESFTVTESVTRPGKPVKFSLPFLGGSNLSALWNFGDGMTELVHVGNLTSLEVAHEYATVGEYHPSLKVSNLISEVSVRASREVSVLDEIEGVTILSEGPTKFPSDTVVEVTVRKGTNISFTICYGQETIYPETQLLVLGTYLLRFNIPHAGLQQLNLIASNTLSSVTLGFFVLVLEDIGTLSVDVIPRETDSILLVKENGVIPERTDLLYSWYEEGTGLTVESAIPTLVTNSQTTGSVFNLTVSNQVSSKSILVTGSEIPERWLSLSHPLNVEVGQDVQFEVTVEETANISLKFGDGGERYLTNENTFTCNYSYTTPGVYAVSALVNYTNGRKENTSSVIAVLEQIVDLQIVGPNVSVYNGPGSKQGWEVIPASGSNIVYKWSIFPVGNPSAIESKTLAGEHTKTYLTFSFPGMYNLTVSASNSISSVQSSVTTLLQEPITRLVVSCNPTLISANAEICVQVVGSTPLEIRMDYDDNVTENWSSEDESIQTIKPDVDFMNANLHMYTIVKNFTSVGEHQVNVTVDNKVSSQFRHHVIIVEDAVSGLVVTSDNLWLVNIQERVVMYATIVTGSDVTFEWDFNDPIGNTSEDSNGTFSKATHFFGSPGEYNVSVSAWNSVQTIPITVTFNITFSVLEAIYGLELRVQDYSRNAPLVQHGDQWKTAVIQFRAECWGSQVMFTFDFQDGTTMDISGATNLYGSYFAIASHRFTQEGKFLVSVIARNLLSNMTATLGEPFLVQIAPTAVRFDKNFYVYRFGDMANLEVQLDVGSQVLFNWSMGDQTDYLNAPSRIEHMYHSEGVFIVTVVAFNSIHQSHASCSIFIQNPIQGVEVLADSHLLATRTTIELEARTFSGNPQWFDWDVGDNRRIQRTSVAAFSFAYLEAGIYAVTVVAGNHISNATSPPLTLTVVESVSRVEILDNGNVFLAGTETILVAITYSGSDVRYIWNFGDGSPEVDTHLSSVNHYYNRTGVYYVTLSGYNQISNKTTTTRIFIVNEMCEPPRLKLFGSENQEFRQSEDIRLEADVKIDCDVSNVADYKWTLNESQRALSFTPNDKMDYFGRRTMFIPRRVLDVGTYVVSLKVQMNGTIVFNTVATSIRVVHSDLVSVIESGTQRFFHRDDMVTMSGALSFDPDDPTSDLSYNWKCLQLESTHPCFGHPGLSNTSSLLPSGNQSLVFPVAWLLTNESKNFEFTLEVGKSGRVSVESFQVITVYQEKSVINLSVDCPHCEGGMVNSNDLLTLEAVCPSCHNGTNYEWSLFIIRDGKTGPSPSDVRCVQDNPRETHGGEAQTSMTSPMKPVTQTLGSVSVSGEETLAGLTTQRQFTDGPQPHISNTNYGWVTPAIDPSMTPMEPTTKSPSVSPVQELQEDSSYYDYEFIEPSVQDQEKITQAFLQSVAPTRSTEKMYIPLGGSRGVGEDTSSYYRGNYGEAWSSFDHDYNYPSDKTTTTSNPITVQSAKPSPEGVESPVYEGGFLPESDYEEYVIKESLIELPESALGGREDPIDEDVGESQNDSPDPVQDESSPSKIEEHLISKVRLKVPLTADQTLTGLSGDSLTIKDGVLLEGRTYAVSLKVTHQETRQEGEVFQYFEVNEAPKFGTCSISPVAGQELDTFFIANCQEWQDKDLPLRFKISYSLNDTGPYTVLYFGMNYAAKFLLPAGYQANDYKVYLKLAIVDNKGGKRSVCDIPIRVEPNHRLNADEPFESIESYLYYLTAAPNNQLSILLDQGDSYSAHAFVQIVTHILNQLENNYNDAVIQCDHYYHPCKIRHVLVEAIQMFPLRDSLEILQTSQALAAVLAVTPEVSVETLDAARDLLLDIIDITFTVPKWELDFNVFYAVITSIAAVYDSQEKHFKDEGGMNGHMLSKELFYQTLDAESRIVNLFTSMKLPNTSPLKHSSSLIDVTADQVNQLSSLKLTTKDVDIKFPSGIETILWNISDTLEKPTNEDDCFNVGLVAYHINPFYWGHDANRITTNIASTHVYSCEGERYNITSLPEGREFMFDIMNFCSEDTVSCNFTFDPNYMNVHQFNMTDDNVGQDLHILLTMGPPKNRAYPLHILLRYNERPYPDEFDEKWIYLEDSMLLDIFLPAGSLNDTGSYYLAVVDGELGEIVYREDTDLLRLYSLTMWWGQCLSWNFGEEEWTDKGCTVVPNTNHFVTQCKCDHVGIHGVSFLPVISHLGQVHVSLLLVNPHNPIVYTLYTVVLGTYLLLFVYCYLTDRHDYNKPGLIFLKDNQPTDKYYYEVTFETGSRPGAGTSAKVSVVIRGDEGHSETKELICYEKPVFERNSRDRFVISVPESLGNITSILIWHDNGGITPGWYLSRVCVRDLLTGEKWFFICEQWFAAEEDDGKIERELKVQSNGIGFQKAFFAKGAQYFSDYYIWSSVFTRPPYSIFTRVQRLTCCYAMCMGFMCVNTLFYQAVDEKAINLSFIDISGEAVLVGIMTALLAIPINFPIIMLFRRAKPLRMPGEIGELYKYIRSLPEKDRGHDVMANIPSEARWDAQLLDHTAERLRNLQNWAREKWKQKPKNLVIKEWRDDYVLGEEITEETSFSSGFEDYNSSPKNNSPWTSPSKDKQCSLDRKSSTDHKKLKQPKLWLPHVFYYLAWGSCIFVIVASSVITLGLGHKFSYRKALYWMQAFYFSFMQCFFVTQPFVMAMFTVAKAWKHRNNIKLFDHYDDNTDLLDPCELEQERRKNYELQFKNAIEARQRARYLRFARPPQAEELEKAKEKMQREKNMFAILRDIILFSTLAFCLLWIAYGKELAIHYPINNGIMDRFVRTPQPFTEITSVDSLWHWMEGDLLDELFRDSWYNEQSWDNTLHGESFLLGKVSLRQVRVHQVTCSVASYMKGHGDSCEPTYNKKTRSREPFGPSSIWRHHTKQDLLRYSKWGMFASYEGDGFVVDLNTTRSSAMEQLTTLRQESWIDEKTRAVLIEFTLYNTPTNMFSSVALLAEMPGSGAVYPFPKIESTLLYRYQTAYDYFIMACEFVFLLLTAVSAKQEVQRAVKLKSKYLHDVWAWLEICTCMLSLTYFAMYVYRFAHVTDITKRLKATYMEEFVDVSFLAYWDQCLRDLIGWLVFIVSFKFLHLFRFNKMVAKFGVVVDSTLKEMLGFLAVYLTLEVAFACFGTLLFGSHYYPMKHVFMSLEVVTILMLGGVPGYVELQTNFPFLWPLFHILYVIVIIIFFSGLMKAVLSHSYHKIKDTHKVEPVGGSEVFVFFWNRLLHQCGIHRLTEEETPVKLPLEFTLAEMEYQVEELLFRMNSVCDIYGVSKLPDKNFESESSHDGRDDGISTCSAEENICESNDEKYEEQYFNPEMRSYLQLNRESDDEDEKTFRDQLTLAIFHQLQQNQTKDSGQDTMSPSNMMEDDFSSSQTDPEDGTSSSRVTKTNGQIIFPPPLENIGSLEEQCLERWPRLAWSDNSSQLSTLSSLEPYSSGLSSRSNNVTPDLTNSDNHDMVRNRNSEYDARLAWRGSSHPDPYDVVRDSEEERAAENTVSMDSFPLPNMLESIIVSSSESETGQGKSSRSQPRKLRKTKSRGKGKGRLSLMDHDNSCLSDDENVQVISFGPKSWGIDGGR